MGTVTTKSFEKIFDLSEALFLILEPDPPVFTILEVNEAYLKATNHKRDDLLGKGVFEIYPDDPNHTETRNIGTLRQSLYTVLKSKKSDKLKPQRFDMPVTGTGIFEKRYWTATNTPVFDSDGNIIHIINSPVDITELYTLTAKVEENERNFRQLVEESPIPMAVFREPDMKLELANQAMFDVLQKDNSIYGKPFLEFMPEMSNQPFSALLDNVYKTGSTYSEKEAIVHINVKGKSKSFYFDYTYKALKSGDGHVSGILVMAVDVTQQVLDRKKIKESEERLRLAVENAEAGIFDTDIVTGKSICSLKHANIFGYQDNNEEWSLDKLYEHILTEDLEDFKNCFFNALKTGDLNVVVRIKRVDDIVRWINIMGKVQYNSKNAPVRIVGTTTDITEKKELEQRKDELIGIVSHELKTPVTSMKAFAQLVDRKLKQNQEKDASEMFAKVLLQIEKLFVLIQDLLDVSRLDAGKLQLRKSKYLFNELARETALEIESIYSHQIIVEDTDDIYCYGDKERTGQVLTNLLTNAVKYSPGQDKVLLRIKTDGSQLQCSIQDFGIGIPREKQKHLFERFYRITEGRNTSISGLGLGLYISAEIIKGQNGKIWFESEAGKGSTFYFSLPLT
ncbi:ATP-binding protein [Rubrolithibacter danxiaensis]|uniref:ATP-binding protein n=1 Tax=Rubrolithibacter danxiaensis TaxID=3390805 RepID=UPI003BF8CE8E